MKTALERYVEDNPDVFVYESLGVEFDKLPEVVQKQSIETIFKMTLAAYMKATPLNVGEA